MQMQVTISVEITDDEEKAFTELVGKPMIPTIYREVVRKSLSNELLSKVTSIDVTAKRER